MVGAAMRWKVEGGRGIPGAVMRKRNGVKRNGWCCEALEGRRREEKVIPALEEGSEMECLVMLCAGSWREEEGVPSALCDRERE
jgi:hypothetical protein